MTPTPAWYEADADDSDRNVTDDVTASTPQEPRGAILPAVEPARGFSDADLLRKRTAALNRTSAENERLRAEVERQAVLLRAINDCHRDPARAILQADKLAGAAIIRAEAAEAKLRDVGAERDALRAIVERARQWIVNCVDPAAVGVEVKRDMLTTLARSQAPQAPAEQDKVWCPCGCGQSAPLVRPATADDEPHAEFGEEFCALSERVDGKRHTWRFDGDDPYIVCHWCDEVRDARTGRVVREANDPQDVLRDGTADDEGVRRG